MQANKCVPTVSDEHNIIESNQGLQTVSADTTGELVSYDDVHNEMK